MWIRSAFWVGHPQSGYEVPFRTAIDGELVPGLAALPGVIAVKALWPRRLEDSPPDIYCQVIVEFADETAVDAMLASPGRAALRGRVKEVAAMFDGTISHIDYETGAA